MLSGEINFHLTCLSGGCSFLFGHTGRFFIVTFRNGARRLQTGEERLLMLAKECESSPVVTLIEDLSLVQSIITVLTKYDLLINQFFVERQIRNAQTGKDC